MSYILPSDLRQKRVRLIDPQGNVEHAEDNVWAHMQFEHADQTESEAGQQQAADEPAPNPAEAREKFEAAKGELEWLLAMLERLHSGQVLAVSRAERDSSARIADLAHSTTLKVARRQAALSDAAQRLSRGSAALAAAAAKEDGFYRELARLQRYWKLRYSPAGGANPFAVDLDMSDPSTSGRGSDSSGRSTKASTRLSILKDPSGALRVQVPAQQQKQQQQMQSKLAAGAAKPQPERPEVYVGAQAVHELLLQRHKQLLWGMAVETLEAEEAGQQLAAGQPAGPGARTQLGASSAGQRVSAADSSTMQALARQALVRLCGEGASAYGTGPASTSTSAEAVADPTPAAAMAGAAKEGGGRGAGGAPGTTDGNAMVIGVPSAASAPGDSIRSSSGAGSSSSSSDPDAQLAALRPLVLSHLLRARLQHLSAAGGAAAASRSANGAAAGGAGLGEELGQWLLHGCVRDMARAQLDSQLLDHPGVIARTLLPSRPCTTAIQLQAASTQQHPSIHQPGAAATTTTGPSDGAALQAPPHAPVAPALLVVQGSSVYLEGDSATGSSMHGADFIAGGSSTGLAVAAARMQVTSLAEVPAALAPVLQRLSGS